MTKKEKNDGRHSAAAGISMKDPGEGKEEGKAPQGKGEGKPPEKEPAPLEKIQVQLEEKTRECSDLFDKWLRMRAEFENYKKRVQKEKEDSIRYGNEDLLKALLPVIDNLNRALEHGDKAREISSLLEGVEMVRKQFLTVLEKFGVKPVPAVGEPFDPEKHEAIAQEEREGDSNRVVAATEEGYFFHDRLLRPAKVVVSKSKGDGRNAS